MVNHKGKYNPSSGGSSCLSCPAGISNNKRIYISVGYYSTTVALSSTCTACPSGSYHRSVK